MPHSGHTAQRRKVHDIPGNCLHVTVPSFANVDRCLLRTRGRAPAVAAQPPSCPLAWLVGNVLLQHILGPAGAPNCPISSQNVYFQQHCTREAAMAANLGSAMVSNSAAVAAADKGLVIRIGPIETERRRNTDKFRWIRIVMLSDTHNKCVIRLLSVPGGSISCWLHSLTCLISVARAGKTRSAPYPMETSFCTVVMQQCLARHLRFELLASGFPRCHTSTWSVHSTLTTLLHCCRGSFQIQAVCSWQP